MYTSNLSSTDLFQRRMIYRIKKAQKHISEKKNLLFAYKIKLNKSWQNNTDLNLILKWPTIVWLKWRSLMLLDNRPVDITLKNIHKNVFVLKKQQQLNTDTLSADLIRILKNPLSVYKLHDAPSDRPQHRVHHRALTDTLTCQSPGRAVWRRRCPWSHRWSDHGRTPASKRALMQGDHTRNTTGAFYSPWCTGSGSDPSQVAWRSHSTPGWGFCKPLCFCRRFSPPAWISRTGRWYLTTIYEIQNHAAHVIHWTVLLKQKTLTNWRHCSC